MLKQKYFLADIFILSAEKQPIKLSWRKIVCLPNALSGVTADREVLRSSVFDYDQRKVGSSYYVGYYDFVEMMEKLVVDEVALDEWKQAYDAASVCWKKTPMIYSMSVGMFSMKRANGVSHYIPSTATSAAAQAANAAYRSTLWYSAVGLARLGW